MTKTNNKTLKLMIAVAILLITLVTLGCLLAGAVTPGGGRIRHADAGVDRLQPVLVVHHLIRSFCFLTYPYAACTAKSRQPRLSAFLIFLRM